MSIGPFKFNPSHFAAFGLIVVGVLSKALEGAVAAHVDITWGWFAGAGITGAVWLAFQETILPDLLGGGGTTSAPKSTPAPAPSTNGPVPPAAARTWTAPAVRKSGVYRVFALPVAAAFLSACGLFGTVEAPVVDCGTRVAVDAAKGMTIVQIVADVAAPCSMDLAAVVAALLASKDPAVASSKAFVEAARVQAVSVEAAKGKP